MALSAAAQKDRKLLMPDEVGTFVYKTDAKVRAEWHPLKDTDGYTLKLTARRDGYVEWKLSSVDSQSVPSIEGRQTVIYYGTSRALRTVNVIAPGVTVLVDYHDIGGRVELKKDESAYFVIYKLNPKADYNEYMVERLHETGSYIVNGSEQWMESTPN